MRKKWSIKQTSKLVVCILVFIFIAVCMQMCYKLFQHEKNWNEKISNLEGKISNLERKIAYLQAKNETSSVTWDKDSFNYLAIGNSITRHGINEYWWNENGMAATTLDNDYVHQFSSLLHKQISEPIVLYAYNFATWEMMEHDRTESLLLLDSLLDENLDLVTIQLSENASDLSTFETDFEELLSYIQNVVSDAEIIVIGDFWDDNEKDDMKKQACKSTDENISFISLNAIKGKTEYQCGLGTTVYDEKDNPHIVEHEGVARHPNDMAMKWIAERILEEIE